MYIKNRDDIRPYFFSVQFSNYLLHSFLQSKIL